MVTETKIKFLMQPKNWNQNRKFTNWKANKRNWNQNTKIWYEKPKLIVYWAKLIIKIKIVISCQDFEFSNHNQNQNSYLKKIIIEINQNSSEFRLAALPLTHAFLWKIKKTESSSRFTCCSDVASFGPPEELILILSDFRERSPIRHLGRRPMGD